MSRPYSDEFALSIRCAICGNQILDASKIIHGVDGEPFCKKGCADAYEAELDSYLEDAAQETAEAFLALGPVQKQRVASWNVYATAVNKRANGGNGGGAGHWRPNMRQQAKSVNPLNPLNPSLVAVWVRPLKAAERMPQCGDVLRIERRNRRTGRLLRRSTYTVQGIAEYKPGCPVVWLERSLVWIDTNQKRQDYFPFDVPLAWLSRCSAVYVSRRDGGPVVVRQKRSGVS